MRESPSPTLPERSRAAGELAQAGGSTGAAPAGTGDAGAGTGDAGAGASRAGIREPAGSAGAGSAPSARTPPGRLVGIGVGPGDPELVTLKARRVLATVDRVVAPTLAPDVVGRAEAIVRQLLPDLAVTRVVFDMRRDADVSGPVLALVELLDAGAEVGFVTLGDPACYSTFSAVRHELETTRPGTAIDTVPGIMAFQALAASAGLCLVDGTESLSLVTALDGPAPVAAALAEPANAVVVYKGGRYLPEITAALAAAGRSGAVVGELLGLPGERLGPPERWAGGPASYLATVVVPPAARAVGEAS